jgi:nucleolar GTP-binding protein
MNLKGLDQVRNSEFYLNAALGKIKHAQLGTTPKDRDKKKELMEKEKVKVVKTALCDSLNRIIKSFPDFDNLAEFYDKLVETSLDKDTLRKELSTLNWGAQKIDELTSETVRKMSSADDKGLHRLKSAYVGRVSSIMKRLNRPLDFLEKARRILLSFPSVKTDTYTLCISGFPNVGKSTLLTKITTAKPEIGAYAFTTKSLNIGYFDARFEKVQVIDSPGTLARFEKMNNIEKQAYLAIKYVADVVVFVFDLTEPYPISDQLRLYENVLEMDKPTLIYFSKRDIIKDDRIEKFIESRKIEKDVVPSPDDLKIMVQKQMKNRFR